jgi:formylglycine-generating enzyme required for sulfatase activity
VKKWTILFLMIAFAGIFFWSCSDDGDGTTDPVNQLPTCTITSPAPYTGFNSGETVQVKVSTEDPDGEIKEVRFYLNGEGEDVAEGFPYTGEIVTTSLPTGGHLIKVETEDNDGGITTLELPFGIKPQAPTNLQIEQNNVYTFTLNWEYGFIGADGFKIERKIDDGEYEEIKITTALSHVDSTLYKKGYATVYYQVKAYKDVYKSDSLSNSYAVNFPAPYNVTYTKLAVSTIQINWQQISTGEDGFKIDKKIGVADWIIGCATIGPNVKTWTDSYANINQELVYRVYGYKGSNTSGSAQTATIVNTFPAPTSLTATQINLTSATIAWTDNSKGETRFDIERKLASEATYAKIGELPGSDTTTKSYNDTSVEPAKIYDYRVRAVRNTDYSTYATRANFSNVFPAPSNLSVVQNNVSSFTLNWTDNSTGEDGFKIERKIDDGLYSEIATVTGTNYTDNAVLKGFGVVYYRVRAYKTTYYSNYTSQSSPVSFPAPTDLSFSKVNINTIKLDWLETSSGEDGFKIDKKVGGSEWIIAFGTVAANIKTWTDTNADINQTLEYRIYAYKGVNTSASASTTAIDNTFPAPSDINITQNNITTATISWTDNSIGEDKFDIERKLSTETTFVKIADVTGSDTTTKTWLDTSIAPNLSYDYRVKAVKGAASSVYISKTFVNSFYAPTNITAAQVNLTTATISWTDNSIGEDKFEIERKLSTETTYNKIADVMGSDTSSKTWNDTPLIPNYIYDYRIKGVKDTFSTAYVSKTYNNIIPAPSNLTVVQNNVYTFTLNWSDNSSGEDGFKIERKIDDGTFAVIATVTGTSYVDNAVSKGFGTVYYQVRAYKGTAYSTYAMSNSTVLFPAPTNLNITQISITSANLNWNDNSSGEDIFEIERKLSTETNYYKIGEISGSDTATKGWVDTNLVQDLTYDYRVKAVKGTNTSGYVAKTGYLNVINAPTSFTATFVSYTTVTLTWLDTYIGEDKFEIERKLSTESTYSKIGEVSGSDASTKTYTDTTIEPNLTYNYRVRIVDGTAYSEYSSVTHSNPFQAPTGLTAFVASETSIKLDWEDNYTGEEGFKIDRKIGTDGTWVTDYATLGANIKTYTNTGLTTGTYYYYRIRAYYSTYNSYYSNEVYTATIGTMIEIPAGSFSMGQTDVATPVHTVNITRPFYLGKYEVTQKEWQTTMGRNPASGYGVGDNYPVYSVSWYSILVYCNKRSIAEDITPCYTIGGSTDPNTWGGVPESSNSTWNSVTCNFSAKGYRLPTEAEWEYAARYNDGRTYPWGETAPSSTLCNYYSNVGATTSVGSYPSGNSNLGLCDMAGNVWEWVWDWYATYPTTTATDPDGPDTAQNYRVLRGGSLLTADDRLRSAGRYYNYPNLDYNSFGFRIARTK